MHVTRRVYRSGEGEYLINRQPCRLRDIRDLFAGTGVATEAYSVIEQGKVDVLLQASAKDRRVIFEEAAGISRFKAKKIEALRRLERVEQNLLRLSDIVDEVESRLRSVRLQAGKARRYKEYADRLQELRTQVGLADWRALATKLDAVETEAESLRTQIAADTAAAEAAEQQVGQWETQTAAIDQEIHAAESALAENRQRVAALETTIEHERTRVQDLEDQAARHRKQLQALSNRAGDLADLWQTTLDRSASGRNQTSRTRQPTGRPATGPHRTDGPARSNPRRKRTAPLVAPGTITHQRRPGQRNQHAGRPRFAHRRSPRALPNSPGRIASRPRAHRTRLGLARRCGSKNSPNGWKNEPPQWATLRDELAESRRQLAQRQKELAGWRERISGATERAAVLEELEKRNEGVGAGAQEVLKQARENPDGPFKQVRGLLADLVQVNVETAPLIEAALGEKAQHLVISPGKRLFDHLAAHGKRLSGRVGFLPLDAVGRRRARRLDLNGQNGVVGRADRFVEAALELAPLVRRLLGSTWIVENLNHALALSQGAGRGANFVTLAGESLSADGAVVVGQRHASGGLISRRSELRAVQSANCRVGTEDRRNHRHRDRAGTASRLARQNGQRRRHGPSRRRRSAGRTATASHLRPATPRTVGRTATPL